MDNMKTNDDLIKELLTPEEQTELRNEVDQEVKNSGVVIVKVPAERKRIRIMFFSSKLEYQKKKNNLLNMQEIIILTMIA